ncbi:MAG TPA: MarR family transcriptional regulator [Pseudonocardiaceae bacterium]|jgi:DNA-binding MarR family transcriptional regulator
MSRQDSREDGSDPAADTGTVTDAGQVADHLSAINRVLRRSITARAQRLPVPLTRPQVLALQILVEEDDRSESGLSLSDLSERLGLAHSTVSGIVSRLERDGMVRRSTCAGDRRQIRIELTDSVRDWVDHELPALRQAPLVAVLRQISAEQRAALLDGLATMQRLLEANTTGTSPEST